MKIDLIVLVGIVNNEFLFEIIKWITPVILFFLAYLINELISVCKKKKEKRIFKVLFLTHLAQVLNQIDDLIKANSNCISRLNDFEKTDTRLTIHYSGNIDRIRQLPFKDIYQVLVKDPSRKNRDTRNIDYLIDRYLEIYKILDFCDVIIKSNIIDNQTTINNINKEVAIWNEGHAQLVKFTNTLKTTLRSENIAIKDDPFVFGLAEIQNQFLDKNGINKQNIEIAVNEMLVPLINHSKAHSSDQRSLFLMEILIESRNAFLQIRAIKSNFSNDLNSKNEHLKETQSKFISILDEIRKDM
jgi:hypothetical protein